jgi:subtilisin family serine protease
VVWIEEALTAWMESGGRAPLALPEYLQKAVSPLPEAGVPLAPGFDPELSLLIHSNDPEMLRMSGFTVRTVAGTVITAQVPLSRIHELGSIPGVRWVEMPRPLRPLLDVSRLEILANNVHGAAQPPYPGSTGAGVVVGVIDTGIDFDHLDFMNLDGTSRVTRIWDQTDLGGPNPPAPFGYGTEWSSAAINAGTARERDLDGHGTHVSGIAAGNGRAAASPGELYAFTGIAPQAEIFFVKTNFQEDGIIDALNWIGARAGVKPAVMNLSLGAQYGPHDGTGTLDMALAGLSGPGRIIVAAAGNDGNASIHAQFIVPASGIVQFPFSISGYTPIGGTGNDYVYIDGWSSGSNFSVSMITPNSTVVGPIGQTGNTAVNTAQGTVRVEQLLDPVNGDRSILIDILDTGGVPPASGTWNVRIQNNSTTTAKEIDFWISIASLGSGGFVEWTDGNQIDNTELVTTPASSDSVIAVGAYVTKTSWPCVASPGGCGYSSPPAIGTIASFSSPGPRRDGFQKPEISAPGMGVASALSSNATNGIFTGNFAKMPGGLRSVSQGTSQSSPHITGVVALLLQNRPTASFREVTQALILSARHDAFTGPGFSTTFGNGKVDALAAVNQFVPVRLLSLAAVWEDGAAVLRWELAETEPGARFVVERGPAESGPFAAVSEVVTGGLSFAWTDVSPAPAEPWYRLVAVLRTGMREALGVVQLASATPELRLWPNAPNPFRSATVISFELQRPADVRLEILDLAGRRIRTLLSGITPQGRHEVEWNGQDAAGHRAGAGIYFYRLLTPEGVLARRMVLTN